MNELVKVMKALSDPGRVKVLKMLEGRELCACEIIRLLGLAQPTVSRHLKILAEAGLVTGRKVGSWVHYRLAQNPPTPYARLLLEALPGWLERDGEVAQMRRAMGELAPLKLSRRPDCCDAAPAHP